MKRILLLTATLVLFNCHCSIVKAQNSVFSYTHQGTTLYYSVDGNQQATVRGSVEDTAFASALWTDQTRPTGNVVIPDTVEHNGVRYPVVALARKLFLHCTEVTSVTLPQAITVIPFGAFAYTAITSMTLHEGITRIDSAAFQTCYSLATVTLPSTLTALDYDCFYYDTSLTSVVIPSQVDSIGSWAFGCCTHLSSLTLSEGVRSIGLGAFNSCHSLTNVTLPSSLRAIGDYALSQNEALEHIVLPEGLVSLGEYAFFDCRSLQRVSLPSTLESVGDGVFLFCLSIDSLVFPDAMRHLAYDVMDSCISLTWCHLPASLEYIDSLTFNYCFALRNVDMPQHINSIRQGAFSECSSLEHIVVPEGVTYIEGAAFDHSGLRTIHLPSTLTSIGFYAFYADEQLDTLFLTCTTPPTLGEDVFSYFGTTLVVPCGAAEAYHEHSVWGRFDNIEENCNGIEEVGGQRPVVSVVDGCIVVEGADGEPVHIYDMTGRPVANHALPIGVYIVKVGQHPAQKVTVLSNK